MEAEMARVLRTIEPELAEAGPSCVGPRLGYFYEDQRA